MAIIGSCGERVGLVECVEGNTIKLTRNEPLTRGEPHYLPLGWVAKVDQAVRLNKRCEDVLRAWEEESWEAN
jgi:hypothetical protein